MVGDKEDLNRIHAARQAMAGLLLRESEVSRGRRAEMDKFEQVMVKINHHGVAMDNLTTLKRIWVLLELHTAFARGMQTQYCGSVSYVIPLM